MSEEQGSKYHLAGVQATTPWIHPESMFDSDKPSAMIGFFHYNPIKWFESFVEIDLDDLDEVQEWIGNLWFQIKLLDDVRADQVLAEIEKLTAASDLLPEWICKELEFQVANYNCIVTQGGYDPELEDPKPLDAEQYKTGSWVLKAIAPSQGNAFHNMRPEHIAQREAYGGGSATNYRELYG